MSRAPHDPIDSRRCMSTGKLISLCNCSTCKQSATPRAVERQRADDEAWSQRRRQEREAELAAIGDRSIELSSVGVHVAGRAAPGEATCLKSDPSAVRVAPATERRPRQVMALRVPPNTERPARPAIKRGARDAPRYPRPLSTKPPPVAVYLGTPKVHQVASSHAVSSSVGAAALTDAVSREQLKAELREELQAELRQGSDAPMAGDGSVGDVTDVSLEGLAGASWVRRHAAVTAGHHDPGGMAPEGLNVLTVAVHRVALATMHGGVMRVAAAIVWLLLCTVLLGVSFASLLTLSLGAKWPSCATSDDCAAGQACVSLRIPGGFAPSLPMCADCKRLATDYSSTLTPWPHALVPSGNASAHCIAALLAPEYARATAGSPSFDSCLYARLGAVSMTPLDHIALQFAFLLVAASIARSVKTHASTGLLRRRCNPWPFCPTLSLSSALRFVTHGLMAMHGALATRAVSALAVPAMLATATSAGGDASAFILAAVVVAVTVGLDQLLVATLVSAGAQERVVSFFRESVVVVEADCGSTGMHGRTAERGDDGSDGEGEDAGVACGAMCVRLDRIDAQATSPQQAATIAFLVVVAALNVGFHRATAASSGISCDQLPHYFFYRVGLQYSLWASLACKVVADASGALASTAHHHPLRTAALFVLDLVARPLLESALVALLLCLAYWAATAVVWQVSAARRSAEQYTRDVYAMRVRDARTRCAYAMRVRDTHTRGHTRGHTRAAVCPRSVPLPTRRLVCPCPAAASCALVARPTLAIADERLRCGSRVPAELPRRHIWPLRCQRLPRRLG